MFGRNSLGVVIPRPVVGHITVMPYQHDHINTDHPHPALPPQSWPHTAPGLPAGTDPRPALPAAGWLGPMLTVGAAFSPWGLTPCHGQPQPLGNLPPHAVTGTGQQCHELILPSYSHTPELSITLLPGRLGALTSGVLQPTFNCSKGSGSDIWRHRCRVDDHPLLFAYFRR